MPLFPSLLPGSQGRDKGCPVTSNPPISGFQGFFWDLNIIDLARHDGIHL